MRINQISSYKIGIINNKGVSFKNTYTDQPVLKNDTQKNNKSKANLPALIAVAAALAIAIIAMIKSNVKKLPSLTSSSSVGEVSNITKPKYLYHMTSFENYESIMNDGLIKKSNASLGDGVFLSDINDLKKYPNNVLLRMINWYKGASNKIVLIKIPVAENNNESLIKWRQINYNDNSSRIISTEWNSLKDFCAKDKEALHSEPLEFLYTADIKTDKIDSAKIIDLSETDTINDFWKAFNVPN